jgi:hypothetical protein
MGKFLILFIYDDQKKICRIEFIMFYENPSNGTLGHLDDSNKTKVLDFLKKEIHEDAKIGNGNVLDYIAFGNAHNKETKKFDKKRDNEEEQKWHESQLKLICNKLNLGMTDDEH